MEFTSGNDTTLKGAQIVGDKVVGNVGGDLTIISDQDTYAESQRQSSSGGGLSVGVNIGAGSIVDLSNTGGNFNTQKQKGDSDYSSVVEQSGIYAGDGGFDITVGGHTGLTGAVIASEADPENNRLSTGSISTEDLYNQSHYEASTEGFGGELSYTKNPGKDNKNTNTGSISPSFPMKEEGDDSSVTKSAISSGAITINDEEAQLAKTGQTADEAVESINRDTDNAHTKVLDRNPDLSELLAKQAELVEATAAASRAVSTTVGDISEYMLSTTKDEGWKDGGIYKTALHAIGFAIIAQLGNGEGLNAALGAIAEQLAAKNVKEVAQSLAEQFFDGNPDGVKLLTNLISNALSTAIGEAVGGDTGGATASSINRWNEQLHTNQMEDLKKAPSDFRLFYEELLSEIEGLPQDLNWTDDQIIAFLAQEAMRYMDYGWGGKLAVENPDDPTYKALQQVAMKYFETTSYGTLFSGGNFNYSDYFNSESYAGSIVHMPPSEMEKAKDFYEKYIVPGITNPDADFVGISPSWWLDNEDIYNEIYESKRKGGVAILGMTPIVGGFILATDVGVRIYNGKEVTVIEAGLSAVSAVGSAVQLGGLISSLKSANAIIQGGQAITVTQDQLNRLYTFANGVQATGHQIMEVYKLTNGFTDFVGLPATFQEMAALVKSTTALAGLANDAAALNFLTTAGTAASTANAANTLVKAGDAARFAQLAKYLAGDGGRWGSNATRQLNAKIAQQYTAKGYDVIGGVGMKEEYISAAANTTKGSTYVDITLKSRTTGEILRIQTVTTKANGITPIQNEIDAAQRIIANNQTDKLILISKETGKVIPPSYYQ